MPKSWLEAFFASYLNRYAPFWFNNFTEILHYSLIHKVIIVFHCMFPKHVWNICINPRNWNSGELTPLHIFLKSLL